MMKLFGIALGTGVTSALLFAVTTTASPAALLLAYLAPLPIMIAGLGFAHATGAAAALIGGGTIGLAMGPVPGLLFLVLLGLPAWYLARLALLGRPLVSDSASAVAGPVASAPAVEWFPVSAVMLRLAALAAGPVLLGGIAVIWRFGGYEAAVTSMAARLAALFGRETLPGDFPFADIVRLAPVAMAGSAVAMLSANLWLAGRAVAISDRLARPWPNLPDGLRMPRAAAALFGTLVAATVMPDPFGLGCAVMAAALGTVFVFEGLATAHVLTRGLAARRATLAAVYLAVVFLMPWPLFALALLGCIDCLFPQLRRGAGIRITGKPTRRL